MRAYREVKLIGESIHTLGYEASRNGTIFRWCYKTATSCAGRMKGRVGRSAKRISRKQVKMGCPSRAIEVTATFSMVSTNHRQAQLFKHPWTGNHLGAKIP